MEGKISPGKDTPSTICSFYRNFYVDIWRETFYPAQMVEFGILGNGRQ
jgi:hypothetical protein